MKGYLHIKATSAPIDGFNDAAWAPKKSIQLIALSLWKAARCQVYLLIVCESNINPEFRQVWIGLIVGGHIETFEFH